MHDFDAVRWVAGREVVEVYATGSNRGEKWIAAAFRAELAAFTELVAGLRPSPCTVADAVESGWGRRGRHAVTA